MRLTILDPLDPGGFPPVESALTEPAGLLAAGGDLSSERLLAAYRHGVFPWYSEGEPILWWSPDPRMVFATDRPHVPRRLQRWLQHCNWRIEADHAFVEVMRACAAPRTRQRGTWITPAMLAAYARLHELGHAHSVEVRDGKRLVGGIYGVAVGRMFFGESMFSRADHGSKIALLALCRILHEWGCPLLDAQISSDHLRTLGAFEMTRRAFCSRVAELTARPPLPDVWRECFPRFAPADLAAPA